ncbi:peptidase E [Umezawaea beigongshangensis]|uniref:Type 1 glutamine amidotransferase-like domain-containing protein n=1 Tax=Umezawaea beigongshangensis TaxID=2780383 RepID=UPI0027DC35B2|nr:peptidase E [Umezawaea beigongshangensis]
MLVPAEQPTILATSGAWRRGRRTDLEMGPLIRLALDLSGVDGRRPRLCHVGTAAGDQRWYQALVDEACRSAGVDVAHLNLFPMPPTDDLEDFVLSSDAVWVGGGSVVNLLALWRVHGLDAVMRRAWESGVVLSGVSAGSICWHVGGTTDSFGPELRVVTDGLALLPHANGVHHDSEPARHPAALAAVESGELPVMHCTDEGAGLLYRGTELVEVVSDRSTGGGWRVELDPSSGKVQEVFLDTRRL